MFLSQAGAQPRMWEASPSEHKKWVEVFKACDEDNKGYLSREDFKVAIVMLFGYKPSKIEADSVMSSVEPNTSGIVLKEFLSIVRKKKEAQVYWNEIRHIFTAFDRHYRGYLTLEDFKKAFRQVAPKLPERIILEVFSVDAQDLCICHNDQSLFVDDEYSVFERLKQVRRKFNAMTQARQERKDLEACERIRLKEFILRNTSRPEQESRAK